MRSALSLLRLCDKAGIARAMWSKKQEVHRNMTGMQGWREREGGSGWSCRLYWRFIRGCAPPLFSAVLSYHSELTATLRAAAASGRPLANETRISIHDRHSALKAGGTR